MIINIDYLENNIMINDNKIICLEMLSLFIIFQEIHRK